MRVETTISLGKIETEFSSCSVKDANLVLYFMSPDYPAKKDFIQALRTAYPEARIVGCTTGGEIAGNEALHKSAVCAAVKLERSHLKIAQSSVKDVTGSYDAGKNLAAELNAPDLRQIFILSDGLLVNGSELVRGITEGVPANVILTGGLAGDGPNFKETGVGLDSLPQSGHLVAVGFYGSKLDIGYGSAGGWLKFGPERLITRSKDNILYELDNQPALNLYKKYLGGEAVNLPGSGLLFPLSIKPSSNSSHDIVRTIVGIDEKESSLIFAGDVPQGYIAQLMRGNANNLTDGASEAATLALGAKNARNNSNTLGILVSCIGRNLSMGQKVSNEVEAVKYVLNEIPLVGFYSYGEICPHYSTHQCGLHNQTMTITLLSEAA